jgi:hypothetical protein
MITTEKNIFKNIEYAETLKSDGVIKIPFLKDDELEKLNSFYDESHPQEVPPTMYDGIHMTIWHSDLDYKLKIRDGIKSIITPAFERNFVDYRALSQQFIVKKKGPETTFPIHQDWSIVDESQHFSLNIWIPMQDVDASNGAMWIIKGSHRLGNKIRGAGTLFPNFHPHLDLLKPLMTSFNMKAGEALIFYHSTIHGSPYNQVEKPRKTIQVTLLPIKTPLHVYFQKSPNDPIEVHHPIDDFNFYYNKIREESSTKPPTDKPIGIIEQQITEEINIQQLTCLLKQ